MVSKIVQILVVTLSFASFSTSAQTPSECQKRLFQLNLWLDIRFSLKSEPFNPSRWFEGNELRAVQSLGVADFHNSDLLSLEVYRAIVTGYGFLQPEELNRFHAQVENFLRQGGTFVINRDLRFVEFYNPSFQVDDYGVIVILIPSVEVVGALANIHFYRDHLLFSFVHELRHYVTFMRVVGKLMESGQSEKEARVYLGRLKENYPISYSHHIAQFEDEALKAYFEFAPSVRAAK